MARQVPTIRERSARRESERQAAKSRKRRETAPHSSTYTIVAALSLAFITFVLYSSIGTHDFINYDDKDYVLNNPHVTAGLTWATIKWSLTATEQANWHPVTWLSHALDCQMFGLDAGYHHLSSLLLHVLNVLLLFLILQNTTGTLGRSFLVAALFAWHPFNVQSVAWVAERKNVLSTTFILLTLAAYVWYTAKPQWQRLAAAAALFVLALASKPMAVSLPFVLLLFDYWPLQRSSVLTTSPLRPSIPQRTIRQLLCEKIPFFALSAMSCVVTIWAQRSGGAMRSLQAFSLESRIGNALQSYGIYITRTVWPFGFSLYYPFSSPIALWKPALSAALLISISVAVWTRRKTQPYLTTGWFWFLGTLVPVIGIVQVGDQAMADRYAYLPLIGLFVMIVWGLLGVADAYRIGRARRVMVSIAFLGICVVSSQQIDYWQNSSAIWSHAFDVTHGDLLVEKQLANALVMGSEFDKAVPVLLHIAQVDPKHIVTHVNLGACYAAQGEIEKATNEFEQVLELTSHQNLTMDDRKYRTSAFLNLGFAYARFKDFDKALTNFKGASEFDGKMMDQMIGDFKQEVSSQPTDSLSVKLSLMLDARGHGSEAKSILEQQLNTNPDYSDSRSLLRYLNAESTVRGREMTGYKLSARSNEYGKAS